MPSMNPKPVSFPDISRALVIKLRHHGDVLLTTPVFSALRRVAPHCEIDALVYAETAPMLENHPAIAAIHTVERDWKELGFLQRVAAEWRLLSALRARHYDLIVHLTDHPRGAWIARMTSPRWSVAPRHRRLFWNGSFSHHYPGTTNDRRHTVEANLDALRRIGLEIEDSDKKPCLVPGTAATARVDELLARHGMHGPKFILLHPTSRWMFKSWTVENYAELITALQARDYQVVVTAAPADIELKSAADILARCPRRPIDLSGQLSLGELGAIIARARLFVGVDSAPMHMAAALGTPVVALFGPTRELEWHPWRVPHRVVTSDRHPCRPCGLDGCGGGKISECLTSITCARVLAAVDELLGS